MNQGVDRILSVLTPQDLAEKTTQFNVALTLRVRQFLTRSVRTTILDKTSPGRLDKLAL
jgi:hypothetical protein